jgi:hypothetical protein
MDEGNLSLWRAGQPASILFAKPATISSNFTVTPPATGTYFFVFDNAANDGRVIVFDVSSIHYVPVLPAFIEYADYELLAVGVLFFILGLKTGKKSVPKSGIQRCKYCSGKMKLDQPFCPRCGRSQN